MKAYNLVAETATLKNGVEIDALALGERGRGRRQTLVPCPRGLEDGDAVCLGETRTGRPKVKRCGDAAGGWLARVSTAGAYIRGANGNVRVPKEEAGRVEVVAAGWGAFGIAGRVGGWDDFLLAVRPPEGGGVALRVKPSRGPARYLVFTEDRVHPFEDREELELWADTLPEEFRLLLPPDESIEELEAGWERLRT